MRARRLRNEQRLKKDKLEVLLSKDYTWQMEKRKQEQIQVSLINMYDTVHVCLLRKKVMTEANKFTHQRFKYLVLLTLFKLLRRKSTKQIS